MLGLSYSVAIDMWSLGCILAELFTGYPLFPGQNQTEQLACIMEIKGIPPRDLIDSSQRKKIFFQEDGTPKTVVNSRGKKRVPNKYTLRQVLRTQDDLFLDFIERCIEWKVKDRMTPDEGLNHQWIQQALRKHRMSTAVNNPGSVHTHESSKKTTSPTRQSIQSNFNSTGTINLTKNGSRAQMKKKGSSLLPPIISQ